VNTVNKAQMYTIEGTAPVSS